jgi:hypothetical protein
MEGEDVYQKTLDKIDSLGWRLVGYTAAHEETFNRHSIYTISCKQGNLKWLYYWEILRCCL